MSRQSPNAGLRTGGRSLSRFAAGRRAIPALLVSALLAAGVLGASLSGALTLVSTAGAYQPGFEELEQMIATPGGQLHRLVFKATTTVFNPFEKEGGDQESSGEHLPVPQPEWSFSQEVFWINGRFLGVETSSLEGQPLHFFWEEGVSPVSAGLDPERVFVTEDIVPPFMPFLETSYSAWKRGMRAWGINPSRMSLVRGEKDRFMFLLSDGAEMGVWIDRHYMVPVRMETVVQGGERPWKLVIEFSDFAELVENEAARPVVFPLTTNYLLDGRLFRQTRVQDLQVNPSTRGIPITSLRNRAVKVLEDAGRDKVYLFPPPPAGEEEVP
ncbi:MAG: hypothetical protein OEZ59_02655 [Deltaproteobacteria bacterium]|nr:hypothetical protein [Deltaproteobacteria bacterium]